MIEIFILTIGASFVQRTTGFGFGIFIMTLLPFLMPSYGEATTLSGLLALTTSMLICIRMRKFSHDRSTRNQRLPYSNRRPQLPFMPRSRADGYTARLIGIQTYPGKDFSLRSILIYRNQRTRHIPYSLTLL